MSTRKGKLVAVPAGLVVVAVLAVVAAVYWPHFRFWWLFEPLGPNAQGYAEYRHRRTGIVFVGLPGGESWMGTSEEEAEELIVVGSIGGHLDAQLAKQLISGEQPRHRVSLSPFLIGKYEVSQSEWESEMERNPSQFQGDNLPVESVSWYDCKEFCRKTGLRLPTEAEWEYACRAGSGDAFCFGNDVPRLAEFAWHRENSGGQTHPVGEKKPNAFGLHDLHGNVVEWCEDVFDGRFYSKPEATTKDPVCTLGSEYRAVRGGGWDHHPGYQSRSASRSRGDPHVGWRNKGLRLAWSSR